MEGDGELEEAYKQIMTLRSALEDAVDDGVDSAVLQQEEIHRLSKRLDGWINVVMQKTGEA